MQPFDPRQGLPLSSPYVAEPATITIGDLVTYRGYVLKVWSILNLTVPLHPDQPAGLYYVLKGNGMHRHCFFILPARDIERPQTFVA